MAEENKDNVTPIRVVDAVKLLTPNELYALIVVEQKAIEFQEGKLKEAEKNLQQVEAQLAFWNNQRSIAVQSMHEVRGAIAGCNTLIADELEKLGVTQATFDEQKISYFKNLKNAKE
jgi:hypothetical protein